MSRFAIGDIVWLLEKDDNTNKYIVQEVTVNSLENEDGLFKVSVVKGQSTINVTSSYTVPSHVLYGYPDKCEKRCNELNNNEEMTEDEVKWFGKKLSQPKGYPNQTNSHYRNLWNKINNRNRRTIK